MNTAQIIKIDFATPTVLNLDDRISLRDIHAKLIEKGGTKTPFHKWINKKLEYYKENKDFEKVGQKIPTLGGAQEGFEYYTDLQIAMEILANGHGKVGHEMRQFMSGCVRKVVERDGIQGSGSPIQALEQIVSSLKYLDGRIQEAKDEIKAVSEGATLTAEHQATINNRINAHAKRYSNHDVKRKFLSSMFGGIKKEFLTTSHICNMRWTSVSDSRFEAIQTWLDVHMENWKYFR